MEFPQPESILSAFFKGLGRKADDYADQMYAEDENTDLNEVRRLEKLIPGTDREEHRDFAQKAYEGLLERGYDRPEVNKPYQIGVTIGVHTGPTPVGVGLIRGAG